MTSETTAAVVRVSDALLSSHPNIYGSAPEDRCRSLALALASGPAWARLRARYVLSVRPRQGLIGLFGSIERRDRATIDALGWQVEESLTKLFPVTWADTEQACLELARAIRDDTEPSELSRARVVGMPRGGLVAAGLLAYALGVPSERIGMSDDPLDPVILVDDCAISGTRTREWIAQHPDRPVIVATLHAHPELARLGTTREPSIRAWHVAVGLRDHAPARPDYADWVRRWSKRGPLDYWIGDPDHLCYPWNEPDVRIWNPASRRMEHGWRVVPPSWCLKNRAEAHPEDLQVCGEATGRLRPAGHVIWATDGDDVLMAAAGEPGTVRLRGTAAQVWAEIARHGDEDRAVTTIEDAYGHAPAGVRTDVTAFLASLAERGLVEDVGQA